MNIKATILFYTHLQINVIDAYPDVRPSPVNQWFNTKQTAIATMVAFVYIARTKVKPKFTSWNIVISDDNDKWLKAAAGHCFRAVKCRSTPYLC